MLIKFKFLPALDYRNTFHWELFNSRDSYRHLVFETNPILTYISLGSLNNQEPWEGGFFAITGKYTWQQSQNRGLLTETCPSWVTLGKCLLCFDPHFPYLEEWIRLDQCVPPNTGPMRCFLIKGSVTKCVWIKVGTTPHSKQYIAHSRMLKAVKSLEIRKSVEL